LGTLKDFENFSKAAKQNGLKIIVDLVINHASIKHSWFKSNRDYFLWSKKGKEFPDAPNSLPHLKPSNWIYNSATGDYYFSTFYPEQADLNWDNPRVLEEFLGIMDFWVGKGVGGFRLDAVSHLIKREGTTSKGLPETHAILKKLRQHVDKNYPEVILLAETHDAIMETKKYFGDGDECHLVYNFPLAEAMFLSLIAGDNRYLQTLLNESNNLPQNCQWANFLRNHDELSLDTLTEEERKKIISFADPEGKYDFKNGKGLSMRLANILKNDEEKIITAFRLLFSQPGLPIIYYGDEIGMKNAKLKEPVLDTRRYVRDDFDWKEAERQIKDPNSLFSAVAEMIKS
jgi:maltose alpha-D-glucosyltransferase/alpha-amylase